MTKEQDIAQRFAALLGPIRWDKIKLTKKKCMGCQKMFKTQSNRICGSCSKKPIYGSPLASRLYQSA